MALKDALTTLIDVKGLSILKSKQSLNILSDYRAFEEHPASKNILKIIIEEGYLEKITFIHENGLPIAASALQYVSELYNKFGFRRDISVYVINAIFEALGYESPIPSESGIVETEATAFPTPKESFIPTDDGTHLVFKGIPINGHSDAVAQALQMQGFKFGHNLENGSKALEGCFAGVNDCSIMVINSPFINSVWKIAVFMPKNNNWWNIKNEYGRFKAMFSKKYGQPASYEYFSYPYEEGDGYELTAFSAGKASYVSFFETEKGSITLRIDDFGDGTQLCVHYEDKQNSDAHALLAQVSAESDI